MIELATFLAANPDARLHGPIFAERFSGYAFDSRIVQPGQLFLAVKTARADGHDYVEAACRGGAAGVVCQRPFDLASFGATCIVVPDTEIAMQRHAAAAVRALGRPVVGITGSAGKTTTKEMVAHVLAGRYRVFRNPANFSGRFGLPIALGGLSPEDELLVLEMAVDHFGEMPLMTEMAPPEVAAVTLVAPAHTRAFGSVEGVAREKGAIVEALAPGGLAILNADDPLVEAMAGRAAPGVEILRCRIVSVDGSSDESSEDSDAGLGRAFTELGAAPSDLLASPPRLTREGTTFTLHTEGRALPVRIPWLGAHFAYAAMIAVAVGRRYGIPAEESVQRLASLPPFRGRLNPIPGRAGSLILDDSYNASPEAVLAGLSVLETLPAGRRVAVLGYMAELGELEAEGHAKVGARAAEVADVLVTRGKEAEQIAEAARAAGMPGEAIHVCHTTEDAVGAVLPLLGPDTLVLAKGSAVARMEQVVAGLMAEPERAPELLVRQDAAWRQIVVIQPDRPTWVEIDLGAVAHNVRRLRERFAPAGLLAVLKADGYGHGALQVAHTALRHGAWGCAVACLSEAALLRRQGIESPIVVLGYTPAWQAHEALTLDLDLAIFDMDSARALSAAAAATDRPARVHVKVDTGMHRLGLRPEDTGAFLGALAELPGLEVVGLFTHMARADEPEGAGRASTEAQLQRFASLLAELDAAGLRPPLVHAANSALALGWPAARYDLVRPGIALYGLAPSAEVSVGGDLDLRPALAWKTQVAQVRELAAGESVGYGGTWTAERDSRIATIPVGYADGFRRAPACWRQVLVRGQVARVVGRVSMDQSSIDVSDIPEVRQGDEVVLIGRQGNAAITAEDVAGWLGTINYEVVSAILARVPRLS
jgi:alanine racemase